MATRQENNRRVFFKTLTTTPRKKSRLNFLGDDYVLKNEGYMKYLEYFNSKSNFEELYNELTKTLTTDNELIIDPSEFDLGQFYDKLACDQPWAKETEYCKVDPKQAFINKNLESYPSCVQKLGKLMFSKSKNTPILVGQGQYEGIYFYNTGKFYNTSTKETGTYSCNGSEVTFSSSQTAPTPGEVQPGETSPQTQPQPQRQSYTPVNYTLDDVKNGQLIKLGFKGNVVSQIQELLIKNGFGKVSKSGYADGSFGPNTLEMTKQFQTKSGLQPTGEIDNETLTKLEQINNTGTVSEDKKIVSKNLLKEHYIKIINLP